MKKFYLPILVAITFITNSNAQQNINFEPNGLGAGYTWNVFENDTNPPLEFVANPSMSGINTSATVAKFTSMPAGMFYAGCETSHENGMPDFVLDAAHATIKIMVYKTVISDVAIKLVTPGSAALPEIKKANTLINQWEELTFDFSAQIGALPEAFDQIVVFPDFSPNPRTYGTVSYFDNITFGVAEPNNPVAPMVAAPNPTLPQANVISLFSGVYTNVPVDTWLTSWSEATMQEVEIVGNATKKYNNLKFAGVETVATKINATDMTHFNLNVWSADFTQIRIKLVDFGANGAYDGPGAGDDKEHELAFEAPAKNEWITYSIPLADFTNLTTRANLSQYIFSSNGTSTVYVDNVYFSKAVTAGTAEFKVNTVVLFPNPAVNTLTIKGDNNIQDIIIYNMLGQQVLNTLPKANEATVNVSQLQSGVYTVHTTANGVVSTQKFIKK